MTVRALPRPALGIPPAPRVPQPARSTLANGLRTAVVRRRETPHLALRVILNAGSSADPGDAPGTASLVGSLLTEGTQLRGAEELHARLDSLGASVEVSVGHDFAEVRGLFLTETVTEGVRLLAEVLTSPVFPAGEFERVRGETLDALEARGDEPANVADDHLSTHLFGATHPYGRPVWGTAESVARIPRQTLIRFHQERYRPNGAVLVAAGDPGDLDLHALLADVLSEWTGAAPLVPVQSPSPPSRTVLRVPWHDAAQAEIRIASPGLPRRSEDWVPAVVANHILGGSTITSRLGANLREARGWTYGVRAGFAAAVGSGGWTAETAVDVDVAEAAVAEMRREIAGMTAAPVGDDELRRAKDALILSLPSAFETPLRVASRLATLEAYALPRDYWERFRDAVEAVQPEDVLRIARAQWRPDRLTEVVVGLPSGGA